MTLDKPTLRRQILQQRQSLPTAEWQHRSNLICDRLKVSSLFLEAKTVLAYFSFRQEPDLASLFSLDRQWGFPRCVGKSLVWHQWQPGDELKSGKYGICEPSSTAPTILPHAADLILVPSVACDLDGYRLGYGGGFYDRLLSEANLPATTIGIVFDFAYEISLPKDNWDIPLNFICSETRFDNYVDFLS